MIEGTAIVQQLLLVNSPLYYNNSGTTFGVTAASIYSVLAPRGLYPYIHSPIH